VTDLSRAAGIIGVVILVATAVSACAEQPQTLDESEMPRIMQLREQQLADTAEGYDITDPPPIPDLVRWITPEEAPAAYAKCVNEAGFAAEDIGGGVDYTGVPDEQAAPGGPLYLAIWTCNAQYSIDPRTQVLLTDEQFRILYDYNNTTLRDCLAQHDVEIADAPSFATFVEDYYSGYPWVPWEEVSLASMGQEAWEALEKDCPQSPPSSELYGAPLPQP